MDFGEFEIFALSGGAMRLDGGAMFGVVPRPLWEKTNPPDEKNRILLGLNALLIKTPGHNILVDTGIGGKGDEKFRSRYCLDGENALGMALKDAGLIEDDITVVINTHLHFDHAGGNTVFDSGVFRPAYGNARYLVQRGELDAALNPNERTRASYRPEDFMPIIDAGLFDLLDGDAEVADGVSVFRTPGHNRDIQLVKIESKGTKAVFLSDTIPTAAHLKYPYIAGYDLFPLETLKAKKEIIEEAARERRLLVFSHDPCHAMGYVSIADGEPVFEKIP
ncbi:MAG: MBL fold metallo-hydrolase [Deltaproteobacteria bacterium]|nr:MBL fold metallo-hydrolase [Deltaproteobacteria bacterium]